MKNAFEYETEIAILRATIVQLQAQLDNRAEPIAYMRNEGTPNNLVKCTFACDGAFGVYR